MRSRISNPADRGSGRPPLALIAGPTASGKSALALALAEALSGTVINADASQVYADLAIVSARPDEGDLARAPHRLFGHIDGAEACTAARWAAEAEAEIDAAHAGGRLPILAGGTGLYLRTLLDGIAPIPDIDPEIRAAIRSMPVAETFTALEREDPVAAARLGSTDTTRIARALEVVRSTGYPIHMWQEKREGGIAARVQVMPMILLPPRDWLYDRINRRFFTMLEQGAMEEVEQLINRDLDPSLPVMRAIGVPAIAANLLGQIDRGTMILEAQQATRRYAKRQYTWFQHQPPLEWPRIQEAMDYNKIRDLVRLFQ